MQLCLGKGKDKECIKPVSAGPGESWDCSSQQMGQVAEKWRNVSSETAEA